MSVIAVIRDLSEIRSIIAYMAKHGRGAQMRDEPFPTADRHPLPFAQSTG